MGVKAPRAEFDCMVFLQGAAREASPAGACLKLARERVISLCLSPEVLAEVRDVLTRPKTRQKFKTLTPERVTAFLQELTSKAFLLSEVPQSFAYPRNPDDEPYINLAIAAGAKYLVSRDKDVLDLAKDSDFQSRFPDLTILDPAAFLQEVVRKAEPGQEPE